MKFLWFLFKVQILKNKKFYKILSFTEVTILLSQTVFSLLVANHITKTSEAIPLLGRILEEYNG